MSLTKFKAPSLRDKQEAKDAVADPRLEELTESLTAKPEEAKPEKKKAKRTTKTK